MSDVSIKKIKEKLLLTITVITFWFILMKAFLDAYADQTIISDKIFLGWAPLLALYLVIYLFFNYRQEKISQNGFTCLNFLFNLNFMVFTYIILYLGLIEKVDAGGLTGVILVKLFLLFIKFLIALPILILCVCLFSQKRNLR